MAYSPPQKDTDTPSHIIGNENIKELSNYINKLDIKDRHYLLAIPIQKATIKTGCKFASATALHSLQYKKFLPLAFHQSMQAKPQRGST